MLNKFESAGRTPLHKTSLDNFRYLQSLQRVILQPSQTGQKQNALSPTNLALETPNNPTAKISKPFFQLNSPRPILSENKAVMKAAVNSTISNQQNRTMHWDPQSQNKSTRAPESRSQATTKDSFAPYLNKKVQSKAQNGDSEKLAFANSENAREVNGIIDDFTMSKNKQKKKQIKKIVEKNSPDKHTKTEFTEQAEHFGLGLENFRLDLVDLNFSLSNDTESRATSFVLTNRVENNFFWNLRTQDKKWPHNNQQMQPDPEETSVIDDILERRLSRPNKVYVCTYNSNSNRF